VRTSVVEITDYPSLVDAVYEVVLGSQEERGRFDVRFSVGQKLLETVLQSELKNTRFLTDNRQ